MDTLPLIITQLRYAVRFSYFLCKDPFPMKECIVPRKEGEFCKGIHDFEKLLDFEIVNIELEYCGVLLNPLAEYHLVTGVRT